MELAGPLTFGLQGFARPLRVSRAATCVRRIPPIRLNVPPTYNLEPRTTSAQHSPPFAAIDSDRSTRPVRASVTVTRSLYDRVIPATANTSCPDTATPLPISTLSGSQTVRGRQLV